MKCIFFGILKLHFLNNLFKLIKLVVFKSFIFILVKQSTVKLCELFNACFSYYCLFMGYKFKVCFFSKHYILWDIQNWKNIILYFKRSSKTKNKSCCKIYKTYITKFNSRLCKTNFKQKKDQYECQKNHTISLLM